MVSAPSEPSASLADAWAWWQQQRFTFNLTLGVAAVMAFALNAALYQYVFHRPQWLPVGGGLGPPLFLGALLLLLMGAANIVFLAGPIGEAWLKPASRDDYRRTVWGLGLGAAMALPFLFPVITLALVLARVP
jgi:hypothetical protein